MEVIFCGGSTTKIKNRSKITFIYSSCKSPLIVTSFKAAGSVCGSGIKKNGRAD